MGALRAVPPFAGYSIAQLQLVDSLTCEVHVPSNRVLAAEGEFVQQLIIVTDGYAAVAIGEAAVGTLGPGSTIGGFALLRSGHSLVTVITVAPASVRVASTREFRSLMHAIPQFATLVTAGSDWQAERVVDTSDAICTGAVRAGI